MIGVADVGIVSQALSMRHQEFPDYGHATICHCEISKQWEVELFDEVLSYHEILSQFPGHQHEKTTFHFDLAFFRLQSYD